MSCPWPQPQRCGGLAASLLPGAVPRQDAGLAPWRSCWLDAASASPRLICRTTAGSRPCLQGVAQTPAGLAALQGQSLSLGRASHRGLLLPSCARGAQAPSQPWQHHFQRGREPHGAGNAGFPARGTPPRAKHRLWPAAGRGPGADRCSLPVLALPLCTSLLDACQPPRAAFLNPFTVKSSSCPAAAPFGTTHPGERGRGGDQHRLGGSWIAAGPSAAGGW